MEQVRGNVLIIEDDSDCGEMCSTILINAGYGVRWVRSRDAALKAMEMYLYQLLLLDYSMPGMGVAEFLNVCRARADTIILMSAVVDPFHESQRLGIHYYLRKPFSPEELVAHVRGISSGILKQSTMSHKPKASR